MLLRFVLCLSLFTTTVLGERVECGTVVTEEEKLEMEKTVSGVNLNPRQATTYDFGIYFNVIAANMTAEGGWVPQKQIDDQITLLNARYAANSTGIRFHLVNVTRVVNRYWHETVAPGLSQTADMHRLFHKGGSTSLNVYSVGFYTQNLNGYATLPSAYRSRPLLDGVVLLFTTLPGGTSLERQGGTLVHESGHWLGLLHTFEGGCTGTGDGVADTPPERDAGRGCPIGRRSCSNSNLPDPIYNFMDYTDETCRREFTPGQISLMHRSIVAYRSNPNI